jgi:hypothetical protein
VPVWADQPRPLTHARRWKPRRLALSALALGVFAVGMLAAIHRMDCRRLLERVITGGRILENWQPPLSVSLLFAGLIIVLLLWKLPSLQVARSKGLSDENRFDRENEARKTLAQIMGGILVLVGLYSSVHTFNLQVQTLDLQRQGQITDRFTKAIEQLGNPKLDIRLVGIYALERIGHDSDKDRDVVMAVLAAYVREHSPRSISALRGRAVGSLCDEMQELTKDSRRIEPDIQAILTVIGRRDGDRDHGEMVPLDGSNLTRAYLHGDFRGVSFTRAQLRGATLEGDFRGGSF